MWFVIQTITGKEQETVEVIDRILGKESYQNCFVIWQEHVWRLQGQYRIHIKPLFPSYVFVETVTPKEFYYALRQVPRLTKLLGSDGTFWNVKAEEEELLRKMIGNAPDHVIRRSPVKVDENGTIISAGGILKEFASYVVKQRLRKRSVIIEIPFLGERKRIHLGIVLDVDTKY